MKRLSKRDGSRIEHGMTRNVDGFPIKLGMTDVEICHANQKQWLIENQEAIDDYNTQIKRRGVFSNGLRKF